MVVARITFRVNDNVQSDGFDIFPDFSAGGGIFNNDGVDVTDLFEITPAAVDFWVPEPGTALLLYGKVLWVEQSENYQRRSGPEVVLAALRTHLDRVQ